MDAQNVINLIKTVIDDAEVSIEGADCNFSVSVVSDAFIGLKARRRCMAGPM